jgi:hypothetical protein
MSSGTPLNMANNLLLGLGVLKLTFGGIVRCSNAKSPLIIEVLPLADSEWPTLDLTFSLSALPIIFGYDKTH